MNESAYRFGEFHLIPARRELWCSGQLAPIQPKVLEAIVYLIQQRDRAVGGDELIAAVWGRTNVTDNVLGQIMSRARRAVGDNGEAQHSIRTVPRFGYRWIREIESIPIETDPTAPVLVQTERTEIVPSDESEEASTELLVHRPDAPPARIRRWERWSISASWAALASVVALAAWTFTQHPAADGSTPTAATVLAVDPSTWSDAERIKRLHDALASDQLDLARAIFGTFSDQERTQPIVRYDAAELALKGGRFDEALRAFNALLSDLGEGGPPLVAGSSLYGVGLAEFRLNHLESAQHYLERAIAPLVKAGAEGQVTLGLARLSLANVYDMREAFDDADRAYAEARAALQESGNLGALAKLENSVGVSLIGRYRYADALKRFQRATELAAQTNDADAEARARMNLVNAQLVLLRPAAALESESRLRELRDRIGDPVLAAHADVVRGKALIANGRLREAALALRAGEARPAGADESLTAMRRIVSAELAFAQGSLDAGARDVRSVLTLPWGTVSDDGLAAYARWRLLEASKAQNDAKGVAEAVAAMDALSQRLPTEPTVRVYAALAHADVADAQGEAMLARSEFERALALAESTHIPFDLVRVVARYTSFLLQRGDVAQANAMADRIASWTDQDYSAALVRLDVDHASDSRAWSATLARTRRLAGERTIPTPLATPPAAPSEPAKARELAAVRGP